MSDQARQRILERLRAAPVGEPVPMPAPLPPRAWDGRARYANLKRLMESVDTEFVETSGAEWPARLAVILAETGVDSLAHGNLASLDAGLAEACGNRVQRHVFDTDAERFRDTLFQVGAGFTTCAGGIADTGSLVLRPDANEPRMLSLVPPVHIVLLHADRIVDDLAMAMTGQAWAKAMPTNLVLVSGPSKTADIEQTLAYGVHGPKRLIVLAMMDGLTGQAA